MRKYPFVRQQGIKECGVACILMIIRYHICTNSCFISQPMSQCAIYIIMFAYCNSGYWFIICHDNSLLFILLYFLCFLAYRTNKRHTTQNATHLSSCMTISFLPTPFQHQPWGIWRFCFAGVGIQALSVCHQ